MSFSLQFRQHADFHRATLQMMAAGATAGLVTHAALATQTSPWAVAVVAAAAMVAASRPSALSRLGDLAARLGLGALAASALVLLMRADQPELAVVSFGALFGLGLGWGLGGARLLASMAVGALIATLGRHVFTSVVTASELASMPGWLVSAGAGAAFSLVSVFALVPRHLEVARDPVATAYDELADSLTGEVKELVDRGYALWEKSEAELERDDVNRETLQEGVMRLLGVAERWRAIEGTGTSEMAESLVERIESLDARIAKSEDAVTKNQYQQARTALVEQLRYIKDIGVSRERVVARMHNYLAAMERLRMAVINLASSNASRDAVDVQPLIENLQIIGADMDSCTEALVEADKLDADEVVAEQVAAEQVAAEQVAVNPVEVDKVETETAQADS